MGLVDFTQSFQLARVFVVALSIMAGLGIYLVLINRLLSQLDGAIKPLVILVAFFSIVGGFAISGCIYGDTSWVWVPIMALTMIAIGEIHRVRIWQTTRGSPPMARSGPSISLAKPITTTDLQINQYRIVLAARKDFRLRIAHLSDFHISDRLPMEYFQRVIEVTNQSDPDLIYLTGDFVSEAKYAHLLRDLLINLKSRYGVYGILGNHDYWAGEETVIRIVRDSGVILLFNGWQRLPIDGLGKLLLLGCEDPWNKMKWVPPEINENDDLILALSHSADNIYRLSKLGATAVFSGHYHAGQFQLPYLGPLVVPSIYGRRFYHGHFLVNDTHLFVTAGIGATNPAIRLYCPPDFSIVDLQGLGSR